MLFKTRPLRQWEQSHLQVYDSNAELSVIGLGAGLSDGPQESFPGVVFHKLHPTEKRLLNTSLKFKSQAKQI